MAKPIQFQVLAEARSLILASEGWCKERYAVGKTGRILTSGSPRAVKHCAVSAIVFAARRCVRNKRDADRIADSAMMLLAPVGSDARIAEKYIWSINDNDGHAAVIDLFETALAMS